MAYLSATIRMSDQRDHRHDAQHGLGRRRSARLDGLLQPIERAGADIAIDHTECGKHHCGGRLSGIVRWQHLGLSLGHPGVLF